MPAADVDDQGEEHAEQGGEADGQGDRPHAAGAAPRRQAQEEAHDRRREAHPQHAEGQEKKLLYFYKSSRSMSYQTYQLLAMIQSC